LQYILENESQFENCEKRWVINRISNKDIEKSIISVLEEKKQKYDLIPYNTSELETTPINFEVLPTKDFLYSRAFLELVPEQRDRVVYALNRTIINYAINNNGARNFALEQGKKEAKWILPWDGNCFLTESNWNKLRLDIKTNPEVPYFVVPMARSVNFSEIQDSKEPPVEEPQMVFRSDSKSRFNEEWSYGRRPKVELFWRLGIPGAWDNWENDPWDQPRPPISQEAGLWRASSGHVIRLPSGVPSLEIAQSQAITNRGLARNRAVFTYLDRLTNASQEIATPTQVSEPLRFARNNVTAHIKCGVPQESALLRRAENILNEALPSVVNKVNIPPSGDVHDYYSRAIYYWPNPDTESKLPYVSRDGHKNPEGTLYSPESRKFDRTSIQILIENTTTLALAACVSQREDFRKKTAELLTTWFIDPRTKMNPHLEFAQERPGHPNTKGSGLIDFSDIYFLLEAVTSLESVGGLSLKVSTGLRNWLNDYLEWIRNSDKANKEMHSRNNHGSWYEVQRYSLERFLGQRSQMRATELRALSRIAEQFTRGGEQPEESIRPISKHYYYYNLQAWFAFLLMLGKNGTTPMNFLLEPLNRIQAGYEFIKANNENWQFPQVLPFDSNRIFPLDSAARHLGLSGRVDPFTETAPTDYQYSPDHGVSLFCMQLLGSWY
jgi:hypothetical protein